MQVAKWGNSLAIRIPKDVVETLKLKIGDEVDMDAVGPRTIEISRSLTREQALEDLRRFEGLISADFKFDREEANAR
ncbi:AbrB family transcriptional regulator [Sphingomonas sp. Leaf357]|uniref:AbrB/MazE/SpoVT family DNA-binding domain-containing protein n=1 Tax=Sphingomonas sp. Leaf357 TaxID=1736350 RepID=UPI0006FE45A0|nr:AbrB/MazE/SpoVT family DNA-binding domain-containing protein [Sphingomonas sp. Leaf357]KQS01837.1 AbrB family transcriptional regulator [Sphingomonas sp. Leaf357]